MMDREEAGAQFYSLARGVFYIIGLSAFLVYVVMCSFSWVSWASDGFVHGDVLGEIYSFLTYFVFIPGPGILLLSVYYFIHVEDLYVNCLGILNILLLSVFHLWVQGGAAHASMLFGFVLQLMELCVAFAIFSYFRKKEKRAIRKDQWVE